MKRRDFICGFAATGLTPLLPTPLLAKGAAASCEAASLSGYALNFAEAFARYHVQQTGRCSPKLLEQEFPVAPELAQRVHERLVASGLLGAPDANGVCHLNENACAKS